MARAPFKFIEVALTESEGRIREYGDDVEELKDPQYFRAMTPGGEEGVDYRVEIGKNLSGFEEGSEKFRCTYGSKTDLELGRKSKDLAIKLAQAVRRDENIHEEDLPFSLDYEEFSLVAQKAFRK